MFEAFLEAAASVVVEFGAQLVVEALAEAGLHAVGPRIARPNPVVAALGYAALGGGLGGLSLLAFPSVLIEDPLLAQVHFVAAPLLAGLTMMLIGALRRRRGETPIRLDTFGYGWLFAAAFCGVRLFFAA